MFFYGYYHDLEERSLTMREVMDDFGQANIILNENTQKFEVKLEKNAYFEFRPVLVFYARIRMARSGGGGHSNYFLAGMCRASFQR